MPSVLAPTPSNGKEEESQPQHDVHSQKLNYEDLPLQSYFKGARQVRIVEEQAGTGGQGQEAFPGGGVEIVEIDVPSGRRRQRQEIS